MMSTFVDLVQGDEERAALRPGGGGARAAGAEAAATDHGRRLRRVRAQGRWMSKINKNGN